MPESSAVGFLFVLGADVFVAVVEEVDQWHGW